MRSVLAKCWMIFAVVAILLAVFTTIARLLLPMAADYREQIERLISTSLGQPVQIGRLEADWHGYGPRLDIFSVQVFDSQHDRLLVTFDEASIGLDLVASLVNGQVKFGNLVVRGVNFSVSHHDDGSFTIQGLNLNRHQQSTGKNNRLLIWLLAQENIAIEGAEVVWQDLSDNRLLHFTAVNLDLRNEGRRHQLDGSAALPSSLGRRISFALDLNGNIQTPKAWSGRGYVNGDGLQLGNLLQGMEPAGMRIDHGFAEARLWSEWRDARLVKLEGIISSFDIKLAELEPGTHNGSGSPHQVPRGTTDVYSVDSLSGRFAWQRGHDGWILAVEDFVLGRKDRLWPSSDFAISVNEHDGNTGIAAQASYLYLPDIRELLLTSNLPGPALRESLEELRPAADLYDNYVEIKGSSDIAGHMNVYGRFENLDLHSWKKFPGVKGLSGAMRGNEQSGAVKFATSSAQLEWEPMFRDPIPINELQGMAIWKQHEGHIELSSEGLMVKNEDLQLHAAMDIDIPGNGMKPYVSLDVRFAGEPGSVARTSRYLPITLMPKATSWLDRSIVGGTISNGIFTFNGRVDQFPFDHGDGRFDVRFDVRDGILDYAEGWPRIEAIEADIHFSGRRMEINATRGKTLDSEISRVRASISDLHHKPAVLELKGKARGPAGNVLRFISETPLSDKFSRYTDGMTAAGNSILDLELIKPLAKGKPARVSGSLKLVDSQLLLADSKVDITDINGQLGFTESTLHADNISATLLGLKSRIDIDTRQEQQISATYFTARGDADQDSIASLMPSPLLKHVHGSTQWTARLRIPRNMGDEQTVSNLHIESDLQGLTIDLPEPLKKGARETRKLVIETGLPRRLDKLVELKFGEELSANLDVDDAMHVERGEIRLGKGIASFPEGTGLHISGKLKHLSLDEWLPLIKSNKTPGEPAPVTAIHDIDVVIDSVGAFERQYHNVSIEAEREPEEWHARVNSQELKGVIQVPTDPQAVINMDLEYLHLSALENRLEQDQVDPRDIPLVHIKCKEFTFNDLDFGSLDLAVSRHPAGIHLDSLKLESPDSSVNARGDWVKVNGEHYSSFTISFNSKDLGQTLASWGYAGSIKKGHATFDIVARWPGPPTLFALKRLDGSLHLKITDGRLLDIDPGAGRIFGLISLQALPRRLSLDFSDIFQKGFSFDRIEGDFILKDGNATTQNLVMDGPAARIEAQGRIGLDARDYDQIVTVNPNVTSSLPLAGAVVGGFGVGAAMLLAQQILEPEIDKATRIKYGVTGPWDNPEIKRITETFPLPADVKGQDN